MDTRSTSKNTTSPATIGSLFKTIDEHRGYLIQTTQNLVRLPSETPPSDTQAVVQTITGLLQDLDNIDISYHTSEHPIENIVAVTKSTRPGKRLVLNGHLDTYPAGDHDNWSDNPFSGTVRDGKIFGRGSADMKGGIACSLLAFRLLAQNPELWSGELVLALAGDEESMGLLGSQYLLDTVPLVQGDAMLCGDVGSPLIPRVGEKGMIWIDVFAEGKSAHGAHVHRGINAIDRLRSVMDSLETLAEMHVPTPDDVSQVIAAAQSVSEPLGGAGEASVMQQITVNFGRITGGLTANLVADKAELNADIRLPMGITVAQVESEINRLLNSIDGIRYQITRRFEPSWTPIDHAIAHAVSDACTNVLKQQSVVNMRIGASDARLFRAAGIPTIVCGLTPHNLGGPDEYVEIEELVSLAKIHTLSAIKYFNSD